MSEKGSSGSDVAAELSEASGAAERNQTEVRPSFETQTFKDIAGQRRDRVESKGEWRSSFLDGLVVGSEKALLMRKLRPIVKRANKICK